ncbi:GDP/GTP exchange factor for ARF [Rhizoclosmatium sp. JEL0117]|nr:GDP/GTP exchange factor for ARF [Rhizoclosmatium sp. JEL0117]
MTEALAAAPPPTGSTTTTTATATTTTSNAVNGSSVRVPPPSAVPKKTQPPLHPRPELGWHHIVHSEIAAVTAAMRKNARWSLSVAGQDYNAGQPLPPHYDFVRDSAVASNSTNSNNQQKGLDFVLAFAAVADPRHINNNNANTNNLNSSAIQSQVLPSQSHLSQTQGAYYGANDRVTALIEGPLLAGFARLKARLGLVTDLRDLEPVLLLAPFLEVIKSGDTTGPITGAALAAVEKFIKYRVLDPNHPNLPYAMSVMTHTAANAKFEASDPASDEVVLTRILRLIRVTVMSEAGQKTLDDKAICEMVETAFGMYFQFRVSELLKRSAEQTLIILVQVLFERLSQILKAKDQTDRPKSSNSNETTDTATLSAPAAAAASDIMRSLKSRQQKGESETVFASSKGDLQPAGTADDDAPVISIADSISAQASHSDRPEVVSVGHHHDNSDDENNTDLEIKLDGSDDVQKPRTDEGSPENDVDNTNEQQPLLENGTADPKHDESAPPAKSPAIADQQQTTGHRVFAPFGLPAILELIRVLVTLMDPRNRNHTDSTHRFVALTLLNVGVEVGGRSLGKWIGWGYEVELERLTSGGEYVITDEDKMALACKDLVVNELIKYLFQILQNLNMTYNSPPSSNNMTLLSYILRVLLTLFQTSRHYLKFQFEYFLDWIMSKVDAGVVSWDVNETALSSRSENGETIRPSSVTGTNRVSVASIGQQNVAGRNVLVAEARELLLETMVQCCRIPGFFTELWVNFDGDEGCRGNLYEEVVRFLSKHTFPDATPGGPVTMINHQVQCVDGLMLLLKHIWERRVGGEAIVTTPLADSLYREPTPEELLSVKLRKRLLSEGAERFNVNPKDGIRFLQDKQLLPTPADPHSIAIFLKTTPGVNKKLIGEYIAKRGNEDILKTFIKLYNFKGKRLDEGLRLLLESFRLPGEAQLIERVVENFAEGYFQAMEDTHDHHIADQSSGFVLAFSIILLNTDQHNPQVRKRMTPEDFQRNNRGCNNGKDFDPEYLRAIYDAIKTNEIVMPEEHEGDLGFSYSWKELMKKTETMNPLMTAPRGSFSKDMFAAVSAATVAAISYAFDSSEDSLTLQKAVVGFHQCASIANLYHMTDVLDNVIISLSKTTGLLKDHGKLPPERKLDAQEGAPGAGETPVRVDPWAVEFGRNYKSQVACVLMFNLAAEYGNSVRAGWKNIIDILGNLFLHSLLPASLLTADNFIRRGALIPRLKVKEKAPAPRKESGGGFFMSLTQLLGVGGNDDDDLTPTAEELDAERNTFTCIAACRIEDLFLDTRFLEEPSLQILLSTVVQASFTSTKLSQRSSQASLFPNEKNSQAGGEKTGETTQLLNQDGEAVAKPKYSLSVAFYLELLINITFHNRDRLRVVWPVAFELISKILIEGNLEHPPLLERAVVGLMRLLIRMVHKEDMLPQVFQAIELITSLPQETISVVAEQLMAGFLQLIKTDPSLILRYPKWDAVLHLLSSTSMHFEASRFSLEAACILVSDGSNSSLTADNFGDCVDLLLSFVTSAGGVILNVGAAAGSPDGRAAAMSPRVSQKSLHVQAATERAIKALEKVFSLNAKIPGLVTSGSIGRERTWFAFWLPLLSGLGQQCYNPGKEIRQYSLTLLQRSLLSKELETTVLTPKANATGVIEDLTTSTLETGVDCFENVLFPLLEELLKPEIRKLDASGMDETRMTVAGLLSRIFLQYLNRLLRYKDLTGLWVKVLDYMNRYVNAGGSEFVSEGVLESLKNMLLVLSDQKVFESNTHNLGTVTWQHIDKCYPGLKEELFPSKGVTEAKATTA